MKLTKYIHSCVLLEEQGDKILFDPGMFSFQDPSVTPTLFSDVQLVVITHNHPDHIDQSALQQIVDLSHAPVLTTPEIKADLEKKGFAGEVHTDLEYSVGAFTIRAVPATHENILAETLPENYGYVINDTLLHPGDSFSAALTELSINTLLLPITAPWATELDVYAFAKATGAQKIIPIHDGYAKDFFIQSRHQNYQEFFEKDGILFVSLQKPGESTEI